MRGGASGPAHFSAHRQQYTAVSPNVTRRWRASTEFGEENFQTPLINPPEGLCDWCWAAGSARTKLNPNTARVGELPEELQLLTPAEQAIEYAGSHRAHTGHEAAHLPSFSAREFPGQKEESRRRWGGGMRAPFSVACSPVSRPCGTRARQAPPSTGFSSRILSGAIDWAWSSSQGTFPNPGWNRGLPHR